jgi:Tol biopolymer transport system component
MRKPNQLALYLFAISMLPGLLGACAGAPSNTPPPQPTIVFAFTQTPTSSSQILPPSPTPVPTQPSATVTKTTTPTELPSPTATHTPQAEFNAHILKHGDDIDGGIATVFWSPDGSTVYYATATGDNEADFHWYAIDISNQGERKLVSAPPFTDVPIFGGSHSHPNFLGAISPSARYRLDLFEEADEKDEGTESPFGYPSAVYSLWLIDATGEQPRTKLLQDRNLYLYQAEWSPNEEVAVIEVGEQYGYGSELYLLSVNNGELTTFSDLMGFDDPNKGEWTLSPDGNWFAVINGKGVLQIKSLVGQKSIDLPGLAYNPRWLADSETIIYVHGSILDHYGTIEAYELGSKRVTKLLAISDIEKIGIPAGVFEVSPDGRHFVFWSEHIWLVSLQ